MKLFFTFGFMAVTLKNRWRYACVISCVDTSNTFAAIVDLSQFNNSYLRLLKISDDNNE
jgi:hypothetical protein